MHLCSITAHLHEEQISVDVLAVTQCLLSAWIAEQHRTVGSYFALTSAIMHWCCITAHFYEQQSSIGVFALTQGCCQPGLQSSTEQRGSYFALNSGAVHWCCITSHLYEEEITIAVIAVTQCLLSAWIANKHRTVGKLFCPDPCYNALVLHHCTPA